MLGISNNKLYILVKTLTDHLLIRPPCNIHKIMHYCKSMILQKNIMKTLFWVT